MLSGVILSAGEGKRMGGFPKALLKIEGRTFLEIICENLFLADIKHVYVVLGYYADMIKEYLPLKKERILINPDPKRGQLSSLQLAITSIPSEVKAIMVTLVDLPLVKLSTYVKLVKEGFKKIDLIHLPVYKCRRGHPVIFPRRFFQSLLDTPYEEGARSVVRANTGEVMTWNVDDPGIFMDFDTVEEYEKR
ncbi:MAG TPA: nucleotidyltransferase family protein [Candidatus Eremiobacteraeota bacterium]|nr:MAG: Nicotine blue oxidoreductase [bacterium ADurb.Bin363]HPZ07312.1 nucleotidyltransferase family protein [Candidatus Eremiobacteraeota bacterium]